MPKTKISEFSATPGNNTDIDGINIAEGCAPSGINDAIRELMSQLKDWQSGTSNDPMVIGSSGSLTLSYGTANGVPYLNGSKVLTTGSALTFNGTALAADANILVQNGKLMLAYNSDMTGYAAFQCVGGSGTQTATWSMFGTSALMQLTSSGNLGLGVTPSAWNGSFFKAFEGGDSNNQSYVGFRVDANTLNIGTNNFFNTSNQYVYKFNGAASRFDINADSFAWSLAPSGTAGNAISFTQAMTLDASGRLSIGTTSPIAFSNQTSVTVNGTNNGRFDIKVGDTHTAAFVGGSSAVEVAAITNVPIIFATNGSERARIDSSGNLLVGTTSNAGFGGHMLVKNIQDGNALAVINSAGTNPYGPFFSFTGAAPNDATRYFLTCADTVATRATIRSNGGIANYQANDVNLSDRREKTNFAPAGEYLSKICAIPVQTFNYIDQNVEEDPGTTLGVVAQDVQAVAPELVMESNWGTEEEPKMRLSIYQTDLQYALMKALQELKAEFDAYKATHP